MKAFLLAAGLGTRLRPLTESVPKCLVPVAGRPLLAWWFDLLERHGITDVLINLHHLPEKVERFAAAYRGPIRIELAMEPKLLGSAGTIHANREFVDDVEQFYILYADNLTNVDLAALREFNDENPSPLTLGLQPVPDPERRGIAQLDSRGRIVEFVEKPEHPRGNLAFAGVAVARESLFDYFEPVPPPFDLGFHVLPRLEGMMNGVEIGGYLRDVGTLESLAAAETEWLAILERSRTS